MVGITSHPRLLEAVTTLLGYDVELGAVVYRSPQPGFGGQRLHADDVPKMSPGPDRFASTILALTDFTADNGTTRVIPGSHRRPDLQRLSGNLESHPEEIRLTGITGTAFVFSGHLLHSGTVNHSSAARPALQITFGPISSTM